MGKTREEFKKAFKAIKKPARPSGVSSKTKDQLETAMDRDKGSDEFKEMAAKLYVDEPKYLVDLIAYKFTKHIDDGGNEKPYWVQHVPAEAFKKALEKVVPNDIDDPLTQATLENSVASDDDQSRTGNLIYARDPDKTTDFILEKYAKLMQGGDKAAATKLVKLLPGDSETTKSVFEKITTTGNSTAAFEMSGNMTNIVIEEDSDEDDLRARKRPLDMEAIYEIAEANPKLFAGDMLRGSIKGKDEFADLVTDKKLQKLLKKEAPVQWAQLVKETPILAVVDNVGKKIAEKGLTKDDAKCAAMFDTIMNNEGMPLAYFTNNLTPSHVMFSGGSRADKEFAAEQKKQQGDEYPDVPATQCHKLLHITTELMNMIPGLAKAPKIVQDTCDNILLTAPLPGIPGKGLLDKSFTGNVFGDDDKPTLQILFTGDSGRNSHTWLVIDNVPYDPVLGTRGDQVAASIQEQFDWLIVDRVAKGPGNRYIVKGEDRNGKKVPMAASNKMGFISGYWITTKPQDYLEDDELVTIGLKEKPKGKVAEKVETE